ncbi:MAG: precorrin-6A/cobalt-precorrin-6A reductase [Thermosynechococcaceae cyanobacterium]
MNRLTFTPSLSMGQAESRKGMVAKNATSVCGAEVVSKNDGGESTYAKLWAARGLGLPTVMIQRPPVPDGDRVGLCCKYIE